MPNQPRIVTLEKRPQNVDMVLYDGSWESAKFIEEWSGGVCTRPDGRSRLAVPDRLRGEGLVLLNNGGWAAVRVGHYVIRHGVGSYCQMPAEQLAAHYVTSDPSELFMGIDHATLGEDRTVIFTTTHAKRTAPDNKNALSVVTDQRDDEAWMHAACLTIAETGEKWGPEVEPSLAMQAVHNLYHHGEAHPKAGIPGTGAWRDKPNFGYALAWLKEGRRVRRAGWNGKDMWLALMPELDLPPASTQEKGAKVNDRTSKFIGRDTPMHCDPYIAMWTAGQTWQPGWNASQADMLADDWEIVPEVIAATGNVHVEVCIVVLGRPANVNLPLYSPIKHAIMAASHICGYTVPPDDKWELRDEEGELLPDWEEGVDVLLKRYGAIRLYLSPMPGFGG